MRTSEGRKIKQLAYLHISAKGLESLSIFQSLDAVF